jgi:predicted metal-dependent peptidase
MSRHPQLERCYDLAIKGAWHHPFFLIPLGHCEWHEATDTEQVQTMAICTKIVKEGRERKPVIDLYINTEWVQGLPDDQVFGTLAHEILHALLRHHERGGGKDQETWGKAADMAINASLVQSSIKIPPAGLLPPNDHYEDAAEELYALLDTGEIKPPKNYDPNKVGQGCMPRKSDPNAGQGEGDEEGEGEGQGNGQGDGDQDQDGDGQGGGGGDGGQDPGEGQGQGQDDGGSDRSWGEMVAQAQSMSRGTGSAKVMARLFKPKPIKTQWERLLKRVARRAVASGGRDNQTFTRINRRSFDSDFTLPGWKSNRPAICAIIDSSGSVSDEMLRASISSVVQCAKVSGCRVFLAIHASEVYFAEWISAESSVEHISSLCTDRGGTDPQEAFEKVGEARGRFDACVYLTDGEVGTYPPKPQNVKHMIVGIVGDRQSSWRAKVPDGWQEVDVEVALSGE